MRAEGPGKAADWMVLVLGAALAALAVPYLVSGFEKLLVGATTLAGIDLRMRVSETLRWWAGEPIYRTDANAVYPPAAYGVLWLLSGGADFAGARVLWAIQTGALLVFSTVGVVLVSRSDGWLQRVVALLLVPSMLAVGAGVGNGQMHLTTVVAGVVAVLVVSRRTVSVPTDIAVAVLMVVALSKPTNGLTFFLLVVFLPGRLRPAALTAALYLVATVVALLPQDESWFVSVARWVDRAVAGAEHGAMDGGTANAQSLLGAFGIESWSTVVAVAFIAVFGEWASRRRDVDPWVLLGVAGLVARLCVYHRSYDDVLVVPALVAVLRASRASQLPGVWRTTAVGLLAAGWVVMAVPERFFPTEAWLQTLQTGVWAALLVFLWRVAPRTTPVSEPPPMPAAPALSA